MLASRCTPLHEDAVGHFERRAAAAGKPPAEPGSWSCYFPTTSLGLRRCIYLLCMRAHLGVACHVLFLVVSCPRRCPVVSSSSSIIAPLHRAPSRRKRKKIENLPSGRLTHGTGSPISFGRPPSPSSASAASASSFSVPSASRSFRDPHRRCRSPAAASSSLDSHSKQPSAVSIGRCKCSASCSQPCYSQPKTPCTCCEDGPSTLQHGGWISDSPCFLCFARHASHWTLPFDASDTTATTATTTTAALRVARCHDASIYHPCGQYKSQRMAQSTGLHGQSSSSNCKSAASAAKPCASFSQPAPCSSSSSSRNQRPVFDGSGDPSVSRKCCRDGQRIHCDLPPDDESSVLFPCSCHCNRRPFGPRSLSHGQSHQQQQQQRQWQ